LAWYHANKERAYAKEKVRLATPEGRAVKRAAVKANYHKNPGPAIRRVIRRKQMYKHLGVPGTHTAEEWLLRCAEFDSTCIYCHAKLTKPTREHIIPISLGPVSSDTIDNIYPACLTCNAARLNFNMVASVVIKIVFASLN
jgi:5-methylcytosine-specific restriction endonuclease McrA